MKNKSYFQLLIILLVIFSCKKDEVEEYRKKPVPVRIVYTSDVSNLQNTALDFFTNLTENNLYKYSRLTYTITATYQYDNRAIVKVIINSGTGDDDISELVYDYYYLDKKKGLLDSVVSTYNQGNKFVWYYEYFPDKHMRKIKCYNYNNQLVNMVRYLTYDGDKPINFRYFDAGNNNNDTLDVFCTYSGNKIIKKVYTSLGTHTYIHQYVYDGQNGYRKNVSTQYDALTKYYSTENIVQSIKIIQDAGSPADTISNTTVTYTYNQDNYPTIKHYAENKIRQYYYEDR